MSCNCCSTEKVLKGTKECPLCHSESEKVGKKTVLSLLKDENQEDIIDSENLYYCNNKDCELVYFSENGTFYKKNLKTNIDDKVCFCFDISKAEIERNGKNKVLDKIKANMKNIGCSCEVKNPSGKCCSIQINKDY